MTIHMDGFNTYMRELSRLEAKNQEAFARGMLEAGLLLEEESKKLVPVDTGALRASSYVKLNGLRTSSPTGVRVFFRKAARAVRINNSPDITVEVGYTQDYAVYVHEDLSMNHPNGGQAKYLEQPARELRFQMFDLVKKAVMSAEQ